MINDELNFRTNNSISSFYYLRPLGQAVVHIFVCEQYTVITLYIDTAVYVHNRGSGIFIVKKSSQSQRLINRNVQHYVNKSTQKTKNYLINQASTSSER